MTLQPTNSYSVIYLDWQTVYLPNETTERRTFFNIGHSSQSTKHDLQTELGTDLTSVGSYEEAELRKHNGGVDLLAKGLLWTYMQLDSYQDGRGNHEVFDIPEEELIHNTRNLDDFVRSKKPLFILGPTQVDYVDLTSLKTMNAGKAKNILLELEKAYKPVEERLFSIG